MIPTAKDFLNRMKQSDMPIDLIMKGFAKLHVQEALKQASEATGEDGVYIDYSEQILNAYPLENIK